MKLLFSLPTWGHILIFAPLAAFLLAAGVTDIKSRKIPNWLTYPAVGLGLGVTLVVFGPVRLGVHGLVVLIVFVAGIIAMLPGWMGGGDVKLLMGSGAFMGPEALLQLLVYSFTYGFVIGLVYAAYTGYLQRMLQNLWGIVRAMFRMAYYRTTNVSAGIKVDDERSELPFGAVVCVGFATLYLEFYFRIEGLISLLSKI